MKNKKIVPVVISLLIVILSASILVWLVSVYKSHKIYCVTQLEDARLLNRNIAISNEVGYFYNEFGGKLEKSELYVIPLSQYGGPDADYSFYKFNSKYYGISDEALLFNGGNDAIRFLYKHGSILYLVNTDERTCKQIAPETEFHSASTGGTYLLEINNNHYNFYKRVNYAYDLYPAVTMNITSNNLSFISWINDRYVLIKSDTNDGFIYLIADAENGDALTCMSVRDKDEEYKKNLISTRYFVKNQDENGLLIFDIYKQEMIEYKYKSEGNITVTCVSSDASYVVIRDGIEYKIVSKNGKSLDFDSFIEGDCEYSEFILDNIIFISTKNDRLDCASIFKILL